MVDKLAFKSLFGFGKAKRFWLRAKKETFGSLEISYRKREKGNEESQYVYLFVREELCNVLKNFILYQKIKSKNC